MFNFLTSIILASLLLPAGFDFLTLRQVEQSYLQSKQQTAVPQRIISNSIGIQTTARTALVADQATQTILYAKNSHVTAPIASITKLMTALVFLDQNPGWQETVTMVEADQREGGIVYLLTGETVTLENLFNVMLVGSANEAAIALARVANQPSFVELMNQKAAALGMTDTRFVDPAGLSSQNVSSPADLLKLATAAFNQPEIAAATTRASYSFRVENSGRRGTAQSTNQLLNSFINASEYKIIGAKTGFLNQAGYCFLLTVQKDNGPTLTVVLLGSDSQTDRWQEAKGLLDWVFSNYQWPPLSN